jgi:hypothetical protein
VNFVRREAWIVALIVTVVCIVACAPVATRGTMPPPGPDGEVDPSAAPDFIAVAGRDAGIAGYTPKRYVLGPPDDEPAPVYAGDLTTLVGHMVVGKGFVPLGVDPATVPDFPVAAGPGDVDRPAGPGTISIYVRNASSATAWFAARRAGQIGSAQGYDRTAGAGCLRVDAGDELVMYAGNPAEPGATVDRVLYVQPEGDAVTTLWIDVTADRAVTTGRGIPGWWSGGPVGC